MARSAARRDTKRSKLHLVASNSRSVIQTKAVEDECNARLEYLQNKRRFFELKPRTENQALLIEGMRESRIVFAMGPAGTGKTFVSTLNACKMLESEQIERIVVTRPMVGCDEDIGFLPGTEMEKYMGWVQPVMEVLEGYFGKKQVQTFIKYEKIVIRPLMMLRGATFRDSFVILDEAQNTTCNQMKMFLTRIGSGTRFVINGDESQSDLPKGTLNGLQDAYNRLKHEKMLRIVEFTQDDVVRDPFVRLVLNAYRD